MSEKNLKDTEWLARRLGVSVSTVERFRNEGGKFLPPHLTVGSRLIRYDEAIVEAWLVKNLVKRVNGACDE